MEDLNSLLPALNVPGSLTLVKSFMWGRRWNLHWAWLHFVVLGKVFNDWTRFVGPFLEFLSPSETVESRESIEAGSCQGDMRYFVGTEKTCDAM